MVDQSSERHKIPQFIQGKNIYDQNFLLSVQKFKSQFKNFPQTKLQVQVALFMNSTPPMNK